MTPFLPFRVHIVFAKTWEIGAYCKCDEKRFDGARYKISVNSSFFLVGQVQQSLIVPQKA